RRGAAIARSGCHLAGPSRRNGTLVTLRLSANGCDGGFDGHRLARHIHTLDGQRLRPQYSDLVGDDAGHDAAQRRADDPDLRDDQPPEAPARPAFCSHNGVHVGVSDRLGAVRCLCDPRGLGFRTCCPDCASDGKARPGIGRHRRHGRRYLPAHPIEIDLPDALPLTVRLCPQPLARWWSGGDADGGGARAVLSGMLLVLDGALVRGGHHEPRMDGRDYRLRLCREAVPGRTVDGARQRCCDAGLWHIPYLPGLTSGGTHACLQTGSFREIILKTATVASSALA